MIRPRRDDDLSALAAVLERVHERYAYPVNIPDDTAAWLTNKRVVASWVCELDGSVVGQVSLASAEGDYALSAWTSATNLPAERMAVVKRLFVDPNVSRRGVGRSLLRVAVDDARGRGLIPVLDVDVDSAPARTLYESAGFRQVGTVDLVSQQGHVFTAACYVLGEAFD